MSFKVAIVGHSQVPVSLANIEGTEIRIFRQGGAYIADIYSKPHLNESFSWGQDLTVLFIGGNDFPANSKESVTTDLLKLVQDYQETGSRVAVFLIESREYQIPNRFNIRNEDYKVFQSYVNNRLKKVSSKRGFRTINLTRTVFETNRSDGVHFNAVGQGLIKTKIRQCVMNHLPESSAN